GVLRLRVEPGAVRQGAQELEKGNPLMRRIAAPLAALLAAAPLLMGASAAGADEVTTAARLASPVSTQDLGRTLVPNARGTDPGNGTADDQKKKEKQKPCPEELWTIPLQVEGLACILLLPKKEEQQKN